MKRIEIGDIPYLRNGSTITLDSTAKRLRVKLDDYEAFLDLTDTEVEILISVFARMKPMKVEDL